MRSRLSKRPPHARCRRDPLIAATRILRRAGVTWALEQEADGQWLARFVCPASGWATRFPMPRNVPVSPVLVLLIYVGAAWRTRHPFGSREWRVAHGLSWPLYFATPLEASALADEYARDVEILRRLFDAFGRPVVRRLVRLVERSGV